jgi:AmpD protein
MHPINFIPSSHHNARPSGTGIDLIVLHAISLPAGEFGNRFIEDFFLGVIDPSAHPSFRDLRELSVSAHFVVDRAGNISQFVPVRRRAWHAGKSVWEGRPDCNDYAIGIEIIGDEETLFTPAQYRETARLCRVLIQRFPGISRDRIVGHRDIAPERKWDPGRQWDWLHFTRSLARIRKLDIEVV